ncbi:hypothetical protein BaRGS_00004617 [Batillaria attramentaria]|uniref:AN1-type zinc finger protein 3 n=1 Tax=Batillaria attramentaria TaxID=370345 RepID=A0ABD0LYW3_9CAEN
MEESSSSQPPLCPCGFWGSVKTLGLCSKCYKEYVEQSKEPLDAPDHLGSTDVSQAKAGRSGKMDSKHCPSRSSADNLPAQNSCASQQADRSLPGGEEKPEVTTSSATRATSDELMGAPNGDSGCNRPPTASVVEEKSQTVTDGQVVGITISEDGVSGSHLVDRQAGGLSPTTSTSASSRLSPTSVVVEMCANERLSAADVPAPQLAASNSSSKEAAQGENAAVSSVSSQSSQSQNEAEPQGTKRSHDDIEKEDAASPGAVKQKNKKRCHKCSVKLELAQREIGRCRCDHVFCPLHRLPELHGCDFDHKEDGRQQARDKMVKPTRHLGTSFRRLENS